MTTALDDKMAVKVPALINKFGANVTFHGETTPVYDPDTGVSSADILEHVIKASPPVPLINRADGEFIKEGDVAIYIAEVTRADSSLPIVIGEKVTVATVDWRIVGFSELRSGESIAAWEIRLRR